MIQVLEATFLALREVLSALVRLLEIPLLDLTASALFYLLASLDFLAVSLTRLELGLSLLIILAFLRGFFFYKSWSQLTVLVALTTD